MSRAGLPIRVEVAAPHERAAALELVYANAPLAGRSSLILETVAKAQRGEPVCDHLLVARTGRQLAGAIWTQIQAGRTAHLWPPQLAAGQPAQVAADLLEAAIDRLSGEVLLVQALLSTDSGSDAELLDRAGFEHISDLLYLVSTQAAFPTEQPPCPLRFELSSDAGEELLASVVGQTYENTRDCPQLNGVRSISDVLAGYRATGQSDAQNWLLIRDERMPRETREVGCVLLAEHSGHTWELVYMGLVPSARGKGFGLEITRYAQWHVARAEGERLVLAVDAANDPALAVYAAAGFTAWDRRSVYLRKLARR